MTHLWTVLAYVVGHRYAGLEAGKECFCGFTYDTHGIISQSRCNFLCPGDNSQSCGGNWALDVYKTFKGMDIIPYMSYTNMIHT